MPREHKLKSIKVKKNNSSKSMNFISNLTFLKIENFIRENRITLRFKVKPFNLITLLTFFPFALGLSQFLGQKYNKNQLLKYFFEKNLPTITKPTEKVDFRTLNTVVDSKISLLQTNSEKNIFFFEYLNSQNFLEFLVSQNTQRGELFFDENFLLVNKNLFLHFFGNQKFTSTLKNQNYASHSRANTNVYTLNSSLKNTNFSFFDIFYRNLDELPASLDTLFQKSSSSNFFLNVETFKHTKQKVNIKKIFFSKSFQTNLNTFLTQPTKPKNHVLSSVSCLKRNFFNQEKAEIFHSEPSPSLSVNTFQDFQNQYYSNSNTLHIHLKKIFLERNLLPSFKKNFSQKFKTKSLPLPFSNKVLLEKFITYIDKQILATDFILLRKMSGYRYPDMQSSEIFCFLLQKNYFSHKKELPLEIRIPSLTDSKRKYNFSIKQLPSFLVYTKPQTLVDLEKDENLYQGPGLVLAPNQGLDWKTKLLQSEEKNESHFSNIHSWFQLYFSAYNPLLKATQQFFGFYKSPEYSETGFHKIASNYWIDNSPVFTQRVTKSNEFSFFPTQLSYQVPFLQPSEWKKMYFDLKTDLRDHSVLTPFMQVQVPQIQMNEKKNAFSKLKNVDYSFTSKLDFVEFSSPIFEIGRSGKVDYEFLFFSSLTNSKNGLLKDIPVLTFSNTFTNKYFNLIEIKNYFNSNTDSLDFKQIFSPPLVGGSYQNIPSLFAKNGRLSFSFFDNWESLTFQSWLIVSQISFAFLVFHTLKALADNYGRELLVYLVDLVAALGFLDDDLKEEIEILMGKREKGFRIILKSRKTFRDIVGIQKFIPEISEIVWFLRNPVRQFSSSKPSLAKGLLLTGPPGTGKTLLAQGLAGEAQVPVLVSSGSSLVEPGESSAVKLEILFQEARKLAPCIVFIDEIDTLAQKRSQVIQNPMGADEILESLDTANQNNFKNMSNVDSVQDKTTQGVSQPHSRQEQLRLLMQFLVELDGIQGRDGVIVVGATNRPEVLDPAVLRPGRFDKILELGLPNQQKRIEILKFYGQRLGFETFISWEYFGSRTTGFAAADLATMMNHSSLHAILKETLHTIETIEYGIDRITSSETDQFVISSNRSTRTSMLKNLSLQKDFKKLEYEFILIRLAYYQAGKIIVSSLLEYHPTVLIAYLWPRKSNLRAIQISKNLQNYFLKHARRDELEQRLVGSYSGKAAEILFLYSSRPQPIREKPFSPNLSNLGLDDLAFGQRLSYLMIQNWSLYSKKSSLFQTLTLPENFDSQEFSLEKRDFFNQLNENLENLFTVSLENDSIFNSQNYFLTAWWQQEISLQLELSERAFSEWYRLYLGNPEERDWNPEWIPPDEFYQGNNTLKNIAIQTSFFNPPKQSKRVWNDFSRITRDYQVHSVILQSFNLDILLLDQTRELLDRISLELLSNQILREPEISLLVNNFLNKKQWDTASSPLVRVKNRPTYSSGKILELGWGSRSRKKLARWIDFTILKA